MILLPHHTDKEKDISDKKKTNTKKCNIIKTQASCQETVFKKTKGSFRFRYKHNTRISRPERFNKQK